VIPNRVYQVEASDGLDDWQELGASFSVPSASPLHLWTDPAPVAGKRFYRVRIDLP
jgi:hypothetical protein